ncbi:hypothetical protein ACI767_04470 [Planococcus plakortidis]
MLCSSCRKYLQFLSGL